MALNNRDRIVASALTQFAKRGYDRVTLRDIAADTGILLGSISHYFPKKEALYKAVLVEAYEGRARQIGEALSIKGSPEDRLRNLVADVVDRYDRDDPYLLLVDRNNADFSAKLVSTAVKNNLRDNYNSYAKMIGDMTGKPVASTSDARVAFISSLIFGFAKLHREYGDILRLKKKSGDDSLVDQLVQFITGAIKSTA